MNRLLLSALLIHSAAIFSMENGIKKYDFPINDYSELQMTVNSKDRETRFRVNYRPDHPKFERSSLTEFERDIKLKKRDILKGICETIFTGTNMSHDMKVMTLVAARNALDKSPTYLFPSAKVPSEKIEHEKIEHEKIEHTKFFLFPSMIISSEGNESEMSFNRKFFAKDTIETRDKTTETIEMRDKVIETIETTETSRARDKMIEMIETIGGMIELVKLSELSEFIELSDKK